MVHRNVVLPIARAFAPLVVCVVCAIVGTMVTPVSALAGGAGAKEASINSHGGSDAPWGQKYLESRLIAPCCWTSTIDMHESDVATKMRGQIHDMLLAGKSTDEIEEFFVAEYGEQVRAAPKGKDPMATVALVAGTAVLLGGVGVGVMVARMVRRKKPVLEPKKAAGNDALDDRIDAELEDLDS